MEVIYEKAKALAEAMAASPELAAVRDAEVKMMMDSEARAIVEEYQTMQTNAMQQGISFENLPADQKQRAEELEKLMDENENIMNFLTANRTFEQIIRSVNMIISSALSGDNSGGCSGCSSAGSCGTTGSCSCGGCH